MESLQETPSRKERETLVSEWAWAMDLAEQRGMLLDDLLDTMGSRTYTLERARSIVTHAAREVAEAIAKRDARPRGRRR